MVRMKNLLFNSEGQIKDLKLRRDKTWPTEVICLHKCPLKMRGQLAHCPNARSCRTESTIIIYPLFLIFFPQYTKMNTGSLLGSL